MTFSRAVLTFMHKREITVADVASVVLDPTESWPDPEGESKQRRVFRQEGCEWALVAHTDRDQPHVIAITPVRAALGKRSLRGSGKRRGESHGVAHSRPAVDSMSELQRRLTDQGYVVEQGGKHLKIHDPQRPDLGSVAAPVTPSDVRSIPNVVAQLRRVFGVRL
ncbi:MAG: hypothetical protein Q4G34_03490 [Micrococcus sp.]|nr:hypothetical protein [Micrococcus sp.]